MGDFWKWKKGRKMYTDENGKKEFLSFGAAFVDAAACV